MSDAPEVQKRFAKVIQTSLGAKTVSENGNRSGTATEQLHRQLATELSEWLAAELKNNDKYRIIFKTEWQISQDAFGKAFNIDLALFLQKKSVTDEDFHKEAISVYVPPLSRDQAAMDAYSRALNLYADDNHMPSLLILVKHPLSSYNKNRFNTAIAEIGEAARITRTYTGEPSGYQVILLSFLQTEMPLINQGQVKSFESPELLPTKEVLKLFKAGDTYSNRTAAHACTVKYSLNKLLMETLRQCLTKASYFKTLQDESLKPAVRIVQVDSIDSGDFLLVVRNLLDQSILRPGGTGKRFNN
jgi:hypothetical protein